MKRNINKNNKTKGDDKMLKKLIKEANALVGMAFVVGLGMLILSKVQLNPNMAVANVTIGKFITGIGEYADWIGIIVLVGVGVYLLKQFLLK
jgi:putative Mn2+ efflux pump MntP